jgi:hypothetical protein
MIRREIVFFAILSAPALLRAEPTTLAENGRALLPVVHGAKTSPRVQAAAKTLAEYLGRISGGTFDVTAWEKPQPDPRLGIYVGLASDFPHLDVKPHWKADEPTEREDYLLLSRKNVLFLIGATDLAVEHAVWDLLYRIGHRQFFPGAHWEVVPRSPTLRIDVDAREHPSYYARRIWYGFGAARWSRDKYLQWCAKNRCVSGIELNSGHAYPGIYNRNKDEFAKHPEYLSLVKGQRRFAQFCISNPGLRELVVKDALAQFAKEPDRHSISVDPNDGGGWCECDACKAYGSVTNRAVSLANQVAAAVNEKHPGKFVGMYAYSQHSPPPTIDVHPRVVISVATGFITGGYSVDQLLDGWQAKKASIGIREYYSVYTWDHDLPGRARGANSAYLARTIPHFHAKGARFLSAESSDNWGCNGLGYYLAARMLWNVKEADRVDALIDDFTDKAFGSAKKPMAEFFRMTDAKSRPLLTDDLVGRMFRLLDEARGLTKDPAILARIDDMILYSRYVDQFLDFTAATGPAHQTEFEKLVKHTYRMRDRLMVHTLAVGRDLPGRDKSLVMPKEAHPNQPEAKNPWMSSTPFSRDEISEYVKSAIERRKLLDFEPVAFSKEFVPAGDKLAFENAKPLMPTFFVRGTRSFWTWVDKAPATIKLKASGGNIYRDKGPAIFNLYPVLEPEGKSAAEVKIAPDKEDHEVALTTTFTGLHRVEVADKGAGTRIAWPDDFPLTVQSTHEEPTNFTGRWSFYFYVPKGTKVVGGYSSGPGAMMDAGGKKIFDFASKPAYFSVKVPQGHDGKIWKMQGCAGERMLMTIPSLYARTPRELLLPAEVVRKDSEARQ